MTKTTLTALSVLVVLFGLSLLATDARAYENPGMNGYGSYAWPYAMNYLLPQRLYSAGHIPVPPYFSLHPPVYYSVPVARTYGYSPYAYPPGTRTPDVPRQRSKMIQNKFFVPGKTTGASATDRVAATTSSARTIINPYVDQPPTLAAGR
ncbi:MAG: hypothetical protein HQ582_15235 [Planctomycetes bacterium]|nr:hypothetical protein [Planctomycetota bacterium]